jgi:outer membrane protein
MRTILKLGAIALLASCTAPAAMAQADDGVAGHLDVHLRGVLVAPEASLKGTIGGAPLTLTNSSITNSFVPEIDATYFLTDNIGVELIAATTQHSVHTTVVNPALGKVDLGSIWLLPPTLTAKYYFDAKGPFRPYIGAGVNYTLFYSPRSGALPEMKYGNSWGTALQVGVDVPAANGYFVNLDVKQLFLNDGVKAVGGAVHAHAVINPLLVGFGVGYRF